MDISSFPCTQLVFAFSLGWTLKEVNINGDFNQYIWAFSLGWTQETDVRVTSSSLLISSGKPEEGFPTNIFSVLNECPTIIYWAKLSGEKVIEALIGQTSIFSESSQLHCVAPDESTQTERQQRESFTKAQWKNYDFTMFWSRIITSHGIAVKWYLRVYWLLPFSIVDSFKKHRRFFCLESTILLESTDDSFS